MKKQNQKNETFVMKVDEFSSVNDMMLNADQLKHMFMQTPEKHKYKRKAKGGGMWTYVTGIYIKKKLNYLFGWNWDFHVVERIIDMENAKQVIVLGKLVCRIEGKGEIVKMQWGRADIKFKRSDGLPLDLGNDLKAATTDALKKCASEIGIASDVYGAKEFKEIKAEIVDDVGEEQVDWEQVKGDLIKHLEACNSLSDCQLLYDSDKRYWKNEEIGEMFEAKMNELRRNEEGGNDG